jgi:hypothetical protein
MNTETASNQQAATHRRDRYIRTRVREIGPQIADLRKEATSLKEDKSPKGASRRQYLTDRIKVLAHERKTLIESARATKAAPPEGSRAAKAPGLESSRVATKAAAARP